MHKLKGPDKQTLQNVPLGYKYVFYFSKATYAHRVYTTVQFLSLITCNKQR